MSEGKGCAMNAKLRGGPEWAGMGWNPHACLSFCRVQARLKLCHTWTLAAG